MLSVISTSALAFEIAPIGTIEADFAGEAIAHATAKVTKGDRVSSTAFLHLIGAFSSLSLTGLGDNNARLDISVSFQSDAPDVKMLPVDVEISYAPTGKAQRWIANETPGRDNISFTTLTFEGDEGHVTGTFSASLCYAESYEDDADMENCRPIKGSFDSPIAIER